MANLKGIFHVQQLPGTAKVRGELRLRVEAAGSIDLNGKLGHAVRRACCSAPIKPVPDGPLAITGSAMRRHRCCFYQ